MCVHELRAVLCLPRRLCLSNRQFNISQPISSVDLAELGSELVSAERDGRAAGMDSLRETLDMGNAVCGRAC